MGTIDSFAILQIFYTNGYYQVKGQSFDLEGNELGNFRCYTSLYDNFVLRYAYDGANIRQPGAIVEGYGEYHFSISKSVPTSFTGFIYDSYHRQKVILQARKITDENLLSDIMKKERRKQIIRLFLEDKL